MPTHSQNTVDYVSSDYTIGGGTALSTHGTERLQKNFPGSPIHDGSLNRKSIQEMGNELLLGAVVNDGGHTFGEQDRDYTGAPNFDDVKTGGGGLPGNAFAPNTASPGPGSMNAKDMPAPPDMPDPGTEFGSGPAGIARKPSELSAGIAKHTLKDYGLGKRAGE